MAERRGRAGGGVEPVGTAGPGWAWGWRGDALLHGEGIRSGLSGWLGRSRLDGMGVCCRVARALQAPGRPLRLGDFWIPRTGSEVSGLAGPSDALSSPPAGAYYPAQGVQQFPAGVPTAQVIVSQQPPIPPKRERKTVRSCCLRAWGGLHAAGGSASPRLGWGEVQHAGEGGWCEAIPPPGWGAQWGNRSL